MEAPRIAKCLQSVPMEAPRVANSPQSARAQAPRVARLRHATAVTRALPISS
jgi:hypothetical protein